MNSILNTVKKMIGLMEEDTSFDTDLIIIINSVLTELTQIGVGDPKGFQIYGADEEWTDFIQNDSPRFNLIQTYVFLKTRMIFATPNSVTLNSNNEILKELEWRIFAEADYHSFGDT